MINWEKVWRDFDKAYEAEVNKKSKMCRSCGHLERPDVDWGDQTKMIQKAVNAQLKKKVKRAA